MAKDLGTMSTVITVKHRWYFSVHDFFLRYHLIAQTIKKQFSTRTSYEETSIAFSFHFSLNSFTKHMITLSKNIQTSDFTHCFFVFDLWVITNNAAMNILIQEFGCTNVGIYFEYIPRSRIAC